MRKIYVKTAFLVVITGIIAVVLSGRTFADSPGHAKGTGSPDEPTCSQPDCHGAGGGNGIPGSPDNSGTGTITLTCSNMSGWTYTPGTTYHMTITVTDANGALFGFSASALDEGLASTGTMVVTDNTKTHVQGSWPISKSYMTHTGATSPAPGTATYTNPAVFNFDWTAPSVNVGPVTIYYDGLAANNNGLEDGGDEVYSGSRVISPTSPVSTPVVLSDLSSFPLRTTSGTPSVPWRFFVGGHGLSGNVTVNAPSPFELALSQNGSYATGALNLNQTSGDVNSTQVWIRYNPTLAGSATQTVTVSSSGATTKSVSVTGAVATPSITTPNPTSLPTFTTTVGTPSALDSFVVSVSSLVDTAIITAPPEFEISHIINRGYTSKITFNGFPPLFAFSNIKIYVRYNPSSAGTHSGNVTISTTGAATQTVAVSGISTAVGLASNIFKGQELNVYPNPAKDHISTKFQLKESAWLEFRIIDMSGKAYNTTGEKLFAKGDQEIKLDTQNLPAGMYFLSVKHNGQTSNKAFIKQ